MPLLPLRISAVALLLALSFGVVAKADTKSHRLSFDATLRVRLEGWDAHGTSVDYFQAYRTRIGAHYRWGEAVGVYAQLQDARIGSLDGSASGAADLYRTHGGGHDSVHGSRLRQLWMELKPLKGLSLRVGRQDIELGTEVTYPEGNWKYVKLKRASQRLVGTVGWTHGERSNDGVSAAYDLGGHHAYAFVAKPTTGVFDLNSSYSGQGDITYGGLSWTVKRDTWMEETEFRFFLLGHLDDRPVSDGGLASTVRVWTGGWSMIGIYPMAHGTADLLFWGALQAGRYNGLSHRAWAGVLEGGYQFKDVPMKPWFRAGINAASGDQKSTDSDHGSFFNMLPTNHLYYGFADRFAFSNLLNVFGQVKLSPSPNSSVNLFVHHFQQLTRGDLNYFGTGAFNKNVFGLPGRAITSHRGLGTELDLVMSYKPHPKVTIAAGYSYMFGHGRFNDLSDDDVRFGFLEVTLKQ